MNVLKINKLLLIFSKRISGLMYCALLLSPP